MSKHQPNEKFSPLIWLIPVPFVLAAFIPLTIDHRMPPKAQAVAVAATDGEPADAASSPRVSQVHAEPYLDR